MGYYIRLEANGQIFMGGPGLGQQDMLRYGPEQELQIGGANGVAFEGVRDNGALLLGAVVGFLAGAPVWFLTGRFLQ